MKKLQVLDLFSGIGGFSLGLESTGGFETAAFCEIDPKAQLVLKKHWPNVPIFGDVTTLKREDIGTIDVICGGFPCQDISIAGTGEGLTGKRSGLFYQILRIVREYKEAGQTIRFVLLENVSALRNRGLDEVLRAFAEIGYDAEWHCIPASHVGSPHRRDRVWILAYPCGTRPQGSLLTRDSFPVAAPKEQSLLGSLALQAGVQWGRPSAHLRMGYGIPCEPHRLKQLGNAVVPAIPALLGKAILSTIHSDL